MYHSAKIIASLIPQLTLAVLALLAVSLLGSRHQNEELLQKLSQYAETLFLEKFPPTLSNDFAAATDLWLVGVALTTPANVHYSVLEEKLRKGHSIKVLLIHPDSTAVQMANMREYTRPNFERLSTEIRHSLETFCELRKITPGTMEIRTIQHPLGHGVVATDPDKPQGALYISNYPFKTRGGSIPRFVLRAKDGKWYQLYREELQHLWNNSVAWKCTDAE